jgi:uncharacterized protein (TIGR03435 family)
MTNLCTQLGLRLGREVIDKTGLAGRFDVLLELPPSDMMPQFGTET